MNKEGLAYLIYRARGAEADPDSDEDHSQHRRRRRRRRKRRQQETVVEEAEGEGRVGEDVYEVFQVQAHAQLKEAVLLQLMALQSTPAMIGARTLPGLTAPLLQLMTLQATSSDGSSHPAWIWIVDCR